jgi:hypothetical protein
MVETLEYDDAASCAGKLATTLVAQRNAILQQGVEQALPFVKRQSELFHVGVRPAGAAFVQVGSPQVV